MHIVHFLIEYFPCSVEVLQKIRKERESEREIEMTTIRKFCCNDLLGFASVHLDYSTITREVSIYLKWMINWSDYSHVAVAPGNRIMGYILGTTKEDDEGEHWRGLSMAVSVASQYRRQKLATKLMRLFENQMVEKMRLSKDDHYYMFLYVGVFNTPAQRFFIEIGYKKLTTIPEFYFRNKEGAIEMIKEVAKERLPRVIRQKLCSFCLEAKSESCSYVCLPPIE